MSLPLNTSSKVAFGLYEADIKTGELWKAGRRVKLQGQPFKVLITLIERSGEVVSREELQHRLWGKDSIGDFDHSLGTAINKIREALGDTADNPRFIETLARRGYRFIAPVRVVDESEERDEPDDETLPIVTAAASPAVPASLAAPTAVGSVVQTTSGLAMPVVPLLAVPVPNVPDPAYVTEHRRSRTAMWLTGSVACMAMAVVAVLSYLYGARHASMIPRIERLTHSGRIAPGVQAMEALPASVTDGLRMFTLVIDGGRPVMAQIDVHTGALEALHLPSEIESPSLGDLSPDGTSLLLRSHLSPESEQALWIVPTSGGSALRLANVVAHDATWMPDGKAVLYAAGKELFVYNLQDGTSRPFAVLPGRAFWLRWSPDGALLRLTMLDPIGHTLGLWEMGRDGKSSRPLPIDTGQASSACCGTWTGDGKYFVFQATADDSGDLWRLDGKATTHPVRLTNGPMSYVAPVTARASHRVFFLGLEAQSTLLAFNAQSKSFVAGPAFLSAANRIEYSRDLQWVIWTDEQGRLWRAHADGSEIVQVTPNSLQVFLAHWSPDGQQLALMARETGKAWQIYLVPPEGGTPEKLLTETRNAADPSWSADGKRLVFGRVTDFMGKEDGPRRLEMLDLASGTVTPVPDSDNLFSPRWSPDGRFIAAISLNQRKLRVLEVATGIWSTLAETSVADPAWTSDSHALVFHASQAAMQPIYRASIADRKLEQIANLTSFAGRSTEDYFFCGLTPQNAPIVRARSSTGDVYSLDLDPR